MTLARKLAGTPPRHAFPPGAVDSQLHMYLPGFPAMPGGPGLPPDPLPTPDRYRQVMRWLGIDRLVITQGNAHQHDNANLLACLAEMGDCARGVAVVAAQTSQAELAALSAAGVVGARIMDLPGGAVGLSRIGEVDAVTAPLGWMLAVQFNGTDLLRHEPLLGSLRSNWVLDHHAKFLGGYTRQHVDAVKRLIDRGNVWFKFSGCYESSRLGAPDYGDVASVAEEIGAYAPERIVWGTNWPHNAATRSEDYPDDAALADLALSWLPDDRARRLALVDNPRELYRF